MLQNIQSPFKFFMAHLTPTACWLGLFRVKKINEKLDLQIFSYINFLKTLVREKIVVTATITCLL